MDTRGTWGPRRRWGFVPGHAWGFELPDRCPRPAQSCIRVSPTLFSRSLHKRALVVDFCGDLGSCLAWNLSYDLMRIV
ncbi:hypothetical protein J5N97_018688 [Dioscorea zingiberensis]|uniref:Uncharacterized protein n=1 Tax=Dioscorea zingiberensis TaxID=325984 RepID=A0A9D5HBQ8_9LILI|nr:hypothetical protein J5N97_018688 [Dioscorea zingiberensis]